MKINVTLVRSTQNMNAVCFNEVRNSVAWALSELGHEVILTENLFAPDMLTIIFGAEQLPPGYVLPASSIIYNLEQPAHPNFSHIGEMSKTCRLWDFNPLNVEHWRSLNLDAVHVPIGYTPSMTFILPSPDEPIDVLFYGWLTPRRVALLRQLRDRNLKVRVLASVYGGARDNLISHSKLIINVHHDGREFFEIVRVSHLLANRRCVLSETSIDQEHYSDLTPGIEWRPYAELADHCVELCRDDQYRRIIAESGFERFSKRDYSAILSRALATTFAPDPARRRVARRYSAALATVPGTGDMHSYAAWIRAHASGNILEIGTRDGASTSAFLSGLDDRDSGHLTSIDCTDFSTLFAGHPRWTFIHSDSRKLSPDMLPGPFDIILVDGDHERDGVAHDLRLAWSLIKPGGFILVHDIDQPPNGPWILKPVREEYDRFIAEVGAVHEELPGDYGMGVIHADPAPLSFPVGGVPA